MKIAVHDYSGHPFQIQLSRALAGRGHRVVHLYSSSNPSTPKGGLESRASDPEGLAIRPIALPRPINKGAFLDRWLLEREYGRRLANEVAEMDPDVVLLANTPLDAVERVQRIAASAGVPLVYWLQDLIGDATDRILSRKLGTVGHWIGGFYRRKERRALRRSEQVVGITEDFADLVHALGLSEDRYVTIANWAPLDEIRPRRRDNEWAREHGLEDKFVFLYSGTLGFKHNPELLLALARGFQDRREVRVVVNSQGDAADWLRETGRKEGLDNLVVNPFQPYGAMSDVLGTADVLVTILEPEAGIYSVPSKVLSYHCAGRAMLLAVPENNLAARIVDREGTGLLARPEDEHAVLEAARWLYSNAESRRQMAERARGYAERTFDIERIAGRFEAVLSRARDTGRTDSRP